MYRSKNNAGPTMERGKNYISSSLKTPSSLLHRESQILTKGIEGKNLYTWPTNSYARINANGKSKTNTKPQKINKQKKPIAHFFKF